MQLQRLQSIFFLLAGLVICLLFVLPITTLSTSATVDTSMLNLLADRSFDISDHIGLIIGTVAISVLAIVTIVLFSKPDLQIKLAYFVMFLCFGLMVACGFLYMQELQLVDKHQAALGTGMALSLPLGLFVPFGSIFLTLLGIRLVRKDRKAISDLRSGRLR